MVTFKTFEVICTTTADKIDLPTIIVKTDMEEYSGWGWQEHLQWISELSGLDLGQLILLVSDGYVVCTDESVSVVWLLSRDYYKSTARLLYEDCKYCGGDCARDNDSACDGYAGDIDGLYA